MGRASERTPRPTQSPLRALDRWASNNPPSRPSRARDWHREATTQASPSCPKPTSSGPSCSPSRLSHFLVRSLRRHHPCSPPSIQSRSSATPPARSPRCSEPTPTPRAQRAQRRAAGSGRCPPVLERVPHACSPAPRQLPAGHRAPAWRAPSVPAASYAAAALRIQREEFRPSARTCAPPPRCAPSSRAGPRSGDRRYPQPLPSHRRMSPARICPEQRGRAHKSQRSKRVAPGSGRTRHARPFLSSAEFTRS
jgi:hypothetical protein